MATHSSVCAWEIPWAEEPGGLQSMRLQRVWHSLVTKPSPPHNYTCPQLCACPVVAANAFSPPPDLWTSGLVTDWCSWMGSQFLTHMAPRKWIPSRRQAQVVCGEKQKEGETGGLEFVTCSRGGEDGTLYGDMNFHPCPETPGVWLHRGWVGSFRSRQSDTREGGNLKTVVLLTSKMESFYYGFFLYLHHSQIPR